MSASIAQFNANRQNAKKSTGPKTQQGKQTASRNATKHGFLAQLVPAEQSDFHEMLDGLLECLHPSDQMQSLLVQQIALAYLRLRRLLRTERDAIFLPGLQEEAIECQHNQPPNTPLLELVHAAAPLATMQGFLESEGTKLRIRYEAMLSRQIQRNLDLLHRLQSEPKTEQPASAPLSLTRRGVGGEVKDGGQVGGLGQEEPTDTTGVSTPVDTRPQATQRGVSTPALAAPTDPAPTDPKPAPPRGLGITKQQLARIRAERRADAQSLKHKTAAR